MKINPRRHLQRVFLLICAFVGPGFGEEDPVTLRVAACNVEFDRSATPEKIGEIQTIKRGD